MKIKTTLLAAAAMTAIAPAANAYEGLYGAIGAGLNYMGHENDVSNDGVSTTPGPFVFDSSAEHDNGIGVYTALGYDWGNNFRTELEYSYRSNDIDHINSDGAGFSGWPNGSITGDLSTHAILANLIYDFSNSSSFTPYIGAGIGVGFVDPDITGTVNPGAPTSPLSIAYGGSEASLAYQGIAGVAIGLAEGLMLDLSYRYFDTLKSEHAGTLNGAPANFDVANQSHSAFAGLRWNFGASAPAPVAPQFKDCWDGSAVPMTAECPPQVMEDTSADLDPVNFTVYFDYDKSNLTSQASDLIREASARALENDIDTVVVAGNTDTSGGSAYNQALSERRARVVRDALIANGVPADRVRMEAYGETNLAKPTADGVREPLNRRADVMISFE
ncbi:OmpA family protein [Hyphococcus flavus]|uniref:OmpA family protein n=1 Tax=Hyphococcus flavus TaxID=1866326 RepID=A0AAE9ZH45_9PROT|nr:OmpA family protein [Hyphococcus flavus]WDI32422.1 OmpA family protein [Hyphococcus flavus]